MKASQLNINFSQSFVFEYKYGAALIRLAESEISMDKNEISAVTGIPTGDSSGKVEPIIHYLTGAGVISSEKKSGRWTISLTELGVVILDSDPSLSEDVSHLLIHLMLCRSYKDGDSIVSIVEPWGVLFSGSSNRLDSFFSLNDFMLLLSESINVKSRLDRICSTFLSTYFNESSLSSTGALLGEFDAKRPDGKSISRSPLSNDKVFFPLYAYYLIKVWEDFGFSEQCDFQEIVSETGLNSIFLWAPNVWDKLVQWMQEKGYLSSDMQTGGLLVIKTVSSKMLVKNIYDELV
ncbi:MAG: hypothetical protein V7739_08975 [Motiliproteus sp.]